MKNCAKDFCFNMLDSFTVNARRNREISEGIESARLFEMGEAYNKLHCKTTTGLQETSKSRILYFYEIYRKNFGRNASKNLKKVEVCRLFRYEVARKSFQKCLNFGGSSSFEESLSAIVRFDAIITDAIGSFGTIVKTFRVPERSLFPVIKEDVHSRDNLTNKPQNRDTFSQDSEPRMKILHLIVAFNILTICFELCCQNCPVASSMNSLKCFCLDLAQSAP